mgnify:CR=1 FL=1
MAVDPRLHHSNIVRQSEYEARLHRLINLLERLIYYLQHGDSSETWATVSRPQSGNKVTVEKTNAVNQTVNLLLTLFSKSDEKEKVCIHVFLLFINKTQSRNTKYCF